MLKPPATIRGARTKRPSDAPAQPESNPTWEGYLALLASPRRSAPRERTYRAGNVRRPILIGAEQHPFDIEHHGDGDDHHISVDQRSRAG
ncbi:MAG TPA: hypothetical protein VFT89_04920 [Rhizobiaceae bacterium]|nr:hypothetical protein [Rhizobiaceae bacterium]